MAKGYIVTRRSFEYNDEINQGTDGGEPQHIYTSKEKAQEAVLKLTHKEFEDGFTFDEYAYDVEDLAGYRNKNGVKERFEEIIPEKVRETKDPYRSWAEYTVGKSITLDQTKELIKLFPDLKLFYVEEVEID
jgi:hypothetical protein